MKFNNHQSLKLFLSFTLGLVLLLTGCRGPEREIPPPPSLARGEVEDLKSKISDEKGKLKDAGIDKQLLGLVAFLHIIQQPEAVASGQSITSLLDTENTDFKKQNPELYTALSNIQLIYNRGGINYVTTKNKKPVALGDLRIENATKAKVTKQGKRMVFQDIAGMFGVAMFIKFEVKSIMFNGENGDIEVELSTGLRKLNLKRDLLSPERS